MMLPVKLSKEAGRLQHYQRAQPDSGFIPGTRLECGLMSGFVEEGKERHDAGAEYAECDPLHRMTRFREAGGCRTRTQQCGHLQGEMEESRRVAASRECT